VDESIADDRGLRVGDAGRRTGSRTDDEGGDRMAGGGLSCGEADDDRLSAKVPEGPVFNDVGGSEHYGSEECTGEQWAVFTRSPASFGFARLANLRALVPSCSTRLGFGDIATKLKIRMRDVCDRSEPSCIWASDTTGWSDVSQIGDIYAASFTSPRGENCKAFLKFGPPWGRGFAWAFRGWLCGAQGKSVSDGDLQSFVSSLIVRVQY
jgi:hypothetical protein